MSIVYIDEGLGVDTPFDVDAGLHGSEEHPFLSLAQAYLQHGPDHDYQVKKKGENEFKPAAKAALKKAANFADAQRKKREAAAKRAEKDAQKEAVPETALVLARSIKITEHPALRPATLISIGETNPEVIGRLRKVGDDGSLRERAVRVRVVGRVQRVSKQGSLVFVRLRRGLEIMQCLLSGTLAQTYDALTLTRETSLEIFGELWEVPPGLHAPRDRELHADFFRIICKAPGGDGSLTNRVPEDGDPTTLLNLRHLALRQDKPIAVMLVRDALESAFHTTYRELGFTKVSPPALVQTQVEGGATLFSLDYYGETAYLTQSSQLYLETLLPSLGDVYCIEKSFRAEKSLTRRHLSEYSHVEAELDFINFDNLLSHIEHVVCRVIDLTLESPIAARKVRLYNPEFTKPSRPFLRMRYSEAIDWLRARGIKNAEGNEHAFGDDIAEAAERLMTDQINRPIFLTHFPVELKSFYMQRAEDDERLTESVDLLMPGVGEVVGGSMRIWDYDELLAAYKREGIDPSGYFWYLDQRKYGSSPHGGYGLGEQRFLAWLMKLWTVREASLYPRFMGRCTP